MEGSCFKIIKKSQCPMADKEKKTVILYRQKKYDWKYYIIERVADLLVNAFPVHYCFAYF